MKPPEELEPCPPPRNFPSFPKWIPFMADVPAKGASRHMKFPYTFTAKMVQFPWKFYYKNNWLFKYYALAVLVTLPVFYKIGKMSNSPNNVKVWEDIRRKEFSGGHH